MKGPRPALLFCKNLLGRQEETDKRKVGMEGERWEVGKRDDRVAVFGKVSNGHPIRGLA